VYMNAAQWQDAVYIADVSEGGARVVWLEDMVRKNDSLRLRNGE
jgi:hypothetical protein